MFEVVRWGCFSDSYIESARFWTRITTSFAVVAFTAILVIAPVELPTHFVDITSISWCLEDLFVGWICVRVVIFVLTTEFAGFGFDQNY